MNRSESAGSAFLIEPPTGPGPGVLLIPSWRGLAERTKLLARDLAAAGFTTLVPDLYGGVVATDDVEGAELLAELDADRATGLLVSSVVALRANAADADAPVGVVGFSSGASLALWLGTRNPGSVAAVVAYYGAQRIDFGSLSAPVLLHFAEFDDLCTSDDQNEMEAHLRLLDKRVEVHRHGGTWHFFAEDGHGEDEAARKAWGRTIEFLSTELLGDA